jgi:hypothetical protein
MEGSELFYILGRKSDMTWTQLSCRRFAESSRAITDAKIDKVQQTDKNMLILSLRGRTVF